MHTFMDFRSQAPRPIQLNATKSAAQVSTLACSILRRTPVCAALSVGLSCPRSIQVVQ